MLHNIQVISNIFLTFDNLFELITKIRFTNNSFEFLNLITIKYRFWYALLQKSFYIWKDKRNNGWRNTVGNVFGYRCVSDCRSIGPALSHTFHGDWSWNIFYGHSPPFCWIIQEGLLSVTSESMCTKYLIRDGTGSYIKNNNIVYLLEGTFLIQFSWNFMSCKNYALVDATDLEVQ